MDSKTESRVLADLQLAKQGSYDPAAMDVLDHVLFDNQDFQAGTVRPVTRFYMQPQNSPYMGGAKAPSETNMELQGQIPNSQYFIAEEVGLSLIIPVDDFIDLHPYNYIRILRSSVLRLILAGRSYDLEVPGSVFLPPVFEPGLNSAANGTRAGDMCLSGWARLRFPIVIEGGAAFNAELATGAANAIIQQALDDASANLAVYNAQIQCRLKGTLIRYK